MLQQLQNRRRRITGRRQRHHQGSLQQNGGRVRGRHLAGGDQLQSRRPHDLHVPVPQLPRCATRLGAAAALQEVQGGPAGERDRLRRRLPADCRRQRQNGRLESPGAGHVLRRGRATADVHQRDQLREAGVSHRQLYGSGTPEGHDDKI